MNEAKNLALNTHNNILLITLLALALSLLGAVPTHAQFADCSTGLLQMPTAEMQEDGTLMITNNFLNKHSLASSGWNYNTFQYGVAVSFWGRVELGYVCTIFNGAWDPRPDEEITERQRIIRNQDRHFNGRFCLLREGDFGLDWMPALVVGVNDFDKGMLQMREGNGFFTRLYVVASKRFHTTYGEVGGHLGYQWNPRTDYSINAPCVGVNWHPVWLQQKGILDGFDLVAEFDSRTFNLGFIVSILENHFEAMFELQGFQWINFGLRYKLHLKR